MAQNGTPEKGPPKGSGLDSPYTQIVGNPRDAAELFLGGQSPPTLDDPGFQPPSDPLRQGNPRARAKLVLRELPVITIQNSWSLLDARAALYGHTIGMFSQSADLIDSSRTE